MIASKQVYSKDSLKAAISAQFGADARFHTCSAENINADELIEFLSQRGKFTPSANGFSINQDAICQH